MNGSNKPCWDCKHSEKIVSHTSLCQRPTYKTPKTLACANFYCANKASKYFEEPCHSIKGVCNLFEHV